MLRREVTKTIKLQKSLYYAQQLNTAEVSKQTWKRIRDNGIGTESNLVTESIDVNELDEKCVQVSVGNRNICYGRNSVSIRDSLPGFCSNCIDDHTCPVCT